MQRNWTQNGEKEGFERSKIEAAIFSLEWQALPVELGMMPGEGIKAAIKELRIPRVSHVAVSSELAPYGFYGIRAQYSNGRAEIFIADMGTYLCPIVSDFYPKETEGQ